MNVTIVLARALDEIVPRTRIITSGTECENIATSIWTRLWYFGAVDAALRRDAQSDHDFQKPTGEHEKELVWSKKASHGIFSLHSDAQLRVLGKRSVQFGRMACHDRA